ILSQKFERRISIATIMAETSQDRGDAQRATFWSDVILSLNLLTVDGMSDEEDSVDSGNQSIRIVKDLDFRHPDFRLLFQRVDQTRTAEPMIFGKAGRKRTGRRYSSQVIEHADPPCLPRSFYRPQYLDEHKGLKLMQGEYADIGIPV
ncbi:hypothetical protein EV361DRAFT_801685, partial [Lentinula raphanica]